MKVYGNRVTGQKSRLEQPEYEPEESKAPKIVQTGVKVLKLARYPQ